MGQFSMQIYRHPVPTSFNQFHYVPVQGPMLSVTWKIFC